MALYFVLGGSGTGKTQVAIKVAKRFGIHIIRVDDYRTSIQNHHDDTALVNALLPPSIYIQKSREELVDLHKQISSIVMNVFEKDITRVVQESVVFEGDDILPSAVNKLSKTERVYAVCLFEENERHVYENISHRDLELHEVGAHIVERQMQHAYDNGKRIAGEAQSVGIPLIPSRPFDTLEERVLKVFINQE